MGGDGINSRVETDFIEKQGFPDWIEPMRAKLTDKRFSDSQWIFERKLDGERCLVYKRGKKVTLYSRNQKVLNNTYPELVKALNQQRERWIADSEIVAFDGKITSFAQLQNRMGHEFPGEEKIDNHPVFLYVFDMPWAGGYNLSRLPLRSRKKALRGLVDFKDPIRYCAHRNENGEKYYREACKKGWEGVIAKRALSKYMNGRSGSWLKFKCVHQQEFVIGGYTEPEGSREGFGALLLGYYKNKQLQYAGKVGTGFDEGLLNSIYEKLQPLEGRVPPFSNGVEKTRAHWVRPALVCEVKFTEWTVDDKLRHPTFLGLRHDKKAKEVIREA